LRGSKLARMEGLDHLPKQLRLVKPSGSASWAMQKPARRRGRPAGSQPPSGPAHASCADRVPSLLFHLSFLRRRRRRKRNPKAVSTGPHRRARLLPDRRWVCWALRCFLCRRRRRRRIDTPPSRASVAPTVAPGLSRITCCATPVNCGDLAITWHAPPGPHHQLAP
jgi:hypothetical protein